MRFLFRVIAAITGKNPKSTPKAVIVDQMLEPRPLPLGRKEFEQWSDRLIAGAMIPCTVEGIDGQKFALADTLMHLGPQESHKPDAYFIHTLRKFAVNQVAHAMRVEYKAKAAARHAAEQVANGATPPVAPEPPGPKLQAVPVGPAN